MLSDTTDVPSCIARDSWFTVLCKGWQSNEDWGGDGDENSEGGKDREYRQVTERLEVGESDYEEEDIGGEAREGEDGLPTLPQTQCHSGISS